MDRNALAALVVFLYALILFTVLRVAGSALGNGSIRSREYMIMIATFAVLAGIAIRIVW
jgi:hypothetical protein